MISRLVPCHQLLLVASWSTWKVTWEPDRETQSGGSVGSSKKAFLLSRDRICSLGAGDPVNKLHARVSLAHQLLVSSPLHNYYIQINTRHTAQCLHATKFFPCGHINCSLFFVWEQEREMEMERSDCLTDLQLSFLQSRDLCENLQPRCQFWSCSRICWISWWRIAAHLTQCVRVLSLITSARKTSWQQQAAKSILEC